MSWGPPEWSLGRQLLTLTPVVVCTSLAAMGLAMLLATLARTEIQVALVGALVVLVPGLLSGCLIPRELLPEAMLDVSRWTPHFWSLEAYRQLLVPAEPGSTWTPDLDRVWHACLVLTGFGAAFLALAWATLRLD
jgi:ABC-type multidrug transport system permease subunit